MPNEATRQGDNAELFRERLNAWWTSVLVGHVDQPHPIHRDQIQVSLEGNTLVITGTVPTEHDRQELIDQLTRMKGNQTIEVRNEVTTSLDEKEEVGVLVQTLISTYESEAQARLAASLLKSHGHIDYRVCQVLTSQSSQVPSEDTNVVRRLLTAAYWPDVERALADGQAVLVTTVDETSAFEAREILDEETGSLATTVLPPEPARVAPESGDPRTDAVPPSDRPKESNR